MRSIAVPFALVWLCVTQTTLPATTAMQVDASRLGTWALVLERSTFRPGPAPKSRLVRYETAGAGLRFSLDGVLASGDASRFEWTSLLDGRDVPVTGSPTYDAVSVRRLDARTLESSFKKAGKVLVVTTSTVSLDGRTLTAIDKGVNVQGQVVDNALYYTKQ